MKRQILHVDVNNAFLSWLAVYKLKNGEKIDIRDQVAVIGGDETRRAGIVLAKSPKAKQFGIVTGETLYSARRKCNNLQVYPSNYKIYKECTDEKSRKEYAKYSEVFSSMCGKVWKYLSTENTGTERSESNDLGWGEYKRLADFILNNVRYYAQIDKQFNALRNPKKKTTEYWTVLNTYAAAFFSVFNKMYILQSDGKKSICTKEKVIGLINNKMYGLPNTNNYYQAIKNNLEECDYECVTTNYTPYVERILGKGAYLHGKLSWFEDSENLAVYDATRQEEVALICQNFVFPFIFIQSGIKPVVSTKQIEELYKAITYLNESDTLVVVGYNFNSDDNHINSMIADWLREENERQLVFFKYVGGSDEDKIKTEKELKVDLINRCQWLFGVQAQVSVIKLHNVDDFENYIKGAFAAREDSRKTKDEIMANIASV